MSRAGLLAVALCVTAAHAGTAVVSERGVKLLLPTLKLSGSTADKGSFSASLGFLYSTDNWQFVLAPRMEVSTGTGLSELLTLKDGLNHPWQYGATLDLVKPGAGSDSQERRRWRAEAYDVCAAACASNADCKFKVGASFDTKVQTTNSDMCALGLSLYTAHERSDATTRGMLPEAHVSIGAQRGDATYKFLTGTTALTEAKSVEQSFKLGAAAYWVPGWQVTAGHLFTVEASLRRTGEHSDASAKGKRCESRGDLDGRQIETCKEYVIGAPTFEGVTDAFFGVGVAEKIHGPWRAAAGLAYRLSDGEAQFGVQVPIYLSFATGSTFDGYGGDYKGVLRVLPVLYFPKGQGEAVEGGVTLQLLGTPTLFLGALD